MTGYAGKPLASKLGLKPGTRVAIVGAPAGYSPLLGPGLNDVSLLSLRARELDLVHLFARDRRRLERQLPRAQRAIRQDGVLWISWPKKTSRLHADLDESQVRAMGLAAGLVDVKVAAIDEDWSGLKFVYRLKDRDRGA